MAIEWYYALADVLIKVGTNIDDVFDLVNEWLAGERRVWLRPATDPVTRLRVLVIWGRLADGAPLAVYGRPDGPDLLIFNARYLNADEAADFERWEDTRDDH